MIPAPLAPHSIDPAAVRPRTPLGDPPRLALLLAPALAVIVGLPGFLTQDGPSHVYNAEILREALLHPGADSFLRTAFEVRLEPVPNWAGHAGLIALLGGLPPRAADQALIALTLLGASAGCLGLARTVAGGPLPWSIVILCALLGLNLPWLFGFYSFLLGSIAFLVTLGVWWRRRDRPGPWLALQLGLLVTLGYFCHPISLGLTMLALAVLACATPGERRRERAFWTLLGLVPLAPLGVVYARLMGHGGRPAPTWAGFSGGARLGSLVERILWIDPITIGRRTALPFAAFESRWNGLAAPVLWLTIGVTLLLLARGSRDQRSALGGSSRPWFLVAGVLLLVGLLAPDSMGASHGHFLTQRVVWLGLVAVVPALAARRSATLRRSVRLARLGTLCLGFALLVQTAFLWDYARDSNRLFQAYNRAIPEVGRRQRLAGLFLDLRGRFRANPLVHLDCWLGVGTENVVWSNYEAAYYYFPVRVKPGPDVPPIRDFEAISIRDRPEDAPRRRAEWAALLDAHHPVIDRLVLWGRDPGIEDATAAWYDRTWLDGPLQVWTRRTIPARE